MTHNFFMVEYIVPYMNTIIIKMPKGRIFISIYKHNDNKLLLVIIISIKLYIYTRKEREIILYYIKISLTLHSLLTS